MLKKIGILLITFLILGIECNAQTQFSPILGKMEKSLFGMTYENQSDDIRLQRIEKTVYGTTSSGAVSQRINKLSQDVCADEMGQEIEAKRDSFASDDDAIKELEPKADKSVNYPIVDAMEQKVFNKNYKGTDINQRLTKLEQQVFNKTYNNDLNTRVERLKASIMPERVAQENNYRDDDDTIVENKSPKYYENQNVLSDNSNEGNSNNNYPSDNLWDNFKNNFNGNPTGGAMSMPTYSKNNSMQDNYGNNSDVVIHLAAVEKSVLKKSFPDDTTSNRLARLELKIFNTTFTDDDEATRLDRIASAYQAKKSSKRYDNNRFSQNMATAMQIGAFLLVILASIL